MESRQELQLNLKAKRAQSAPNINQNDQIRNRKKTNDSYKGRSNLNS